jgi:tetratricopeptide (TPR) repeat protein
MKRARVILVAAIYAACLASAAAGQRVADNTAALVERANLFIMQGRCEDAIPLLERVTAQNRRNAAANEMLAGCYIKTARAADAAALLERCVEEFPGHTPYLQELGQAYLEMGEKDKAVAAWRRLLGGDVKIRSMYGLVAQMEQEAGLYEEAIATLRAGLAFKDNADFHAREMIRLERLIGREEDAFRDALSLLVQRQGMLEGELRNVSLIFRESTRQDRLVAVVDSMAAADGDRNRTLRMLKTVLLVEGARYDEARKHLFGKDEQALREDQLYALIVYMGRMQDAQEDARFVALNNDLMQTYLDRYGTSGFAPGVMLLMAQGKREEAKSAGPARERLLEEALKLAGGVKRTGLGAPYFERAAMFKARVLFEDMHRPAEALAELANVTRRDASQAVEAADLRMRILLAAGNWDEAAAGLKRLSADPDTTVALCGLYGLGRLAFLAGRYGESVKLLSDLAERYPSSAWANDALELAMDVKRGMQDGAPGALSRYRAAVLAESRGEYALAVDSLAALEETFSESSLAPRAVFMKALIEVETGKRDAARADFARLAEKWPLDELAPRALERKAGMYEQQDPAEALAQYGLLMERYPDYPFLERVRERYVALGKSVGAEAPKKGSK